MDEQKEAAANLDKKDKDEELGSDEEDDSDQEVSKEQLTSELIVHARESQTAECVERLDKGADPLFMKDGWNCVLWAACNGNEDLIRALIKHGAF